MKTVVLDPGHGGKDTGATYQGHKEKNINLKLALGVRKKLREDYKVKVLMTRSKDHTISLQKRTDYANHHGADYFCSIHQNSGRGEGFESYIFNGKVPKPTQQTQEDIHKTIVDRITDTYDITDRGQKRANFHVLRGSKMGAILLEVAFIDNSHDVKQLTSARFRNDAAAAIADGIAKAMSLPDAGQTTLYYVIAGSFKDKQSAKNRIAFLKQQQIEATIKETQISGETYYRVQAGAFRKRANANHRITELKKMGIAEPFVTTSPSHAEAIGKSAEPKRIRGELALNAPDMDRYAHHLNPQAPKLGEYYERFGEHYGIRGDIAFAQALLETDNFRFTGVVDPEQHNYAGLGAVDENSSGASFATPEKGVLAQIQHLYAYATDDPLPEGYALIDPRFDKVTRSSAKTWMALNGKWAVPGKGYGQKIVRKYHQMKQYAQDSPAKKPASRLFTKLWHILKQALRL